MVARSSTHSSVHHRILDDPVAQKNFRLVNLKNPTILLEACVTVCHQRLWQLFSQISEHVLLLVASISCFELRKTFT